MQNILMLLALTFAAMIGATIQASMDSDRHIEIIEAGCKIT